MPSHDRNHQPVGANVWYQPEPTPSIDGLRWYRGRCTVLQATAPHPSGKTPARTERVLFVANTAHQSGETRLISTSADDVTMRDNVFFISDPVEQMVRLGWSGGTNNHRSLLVGNRFYGQVPDQGTTSLKSWKDKADVIASFLWSNGIDELRVENNDFVNVVGAARLSTQHRCVFIGNHWEDAFKVGHLKGSRQPGPREFVFQSLKGSVYVADNSITTRFPGEIRGNSSR